MTRHACSHRRGDTPRPRLTRACPLGVVPSTHLGHLGVTMWPPERRGPPRGPPVPSAHSGGFPAPPAGARCCLQPGDPDVSSSLAHAPTCKLAPGREGERCTAPSAPGALVSCAWPRSSVGTTRLSVQDRPRGVTWDWLGPSNRWLETGPPMWTALASRILTQL